MKKFKVSELLSRDEMKNVAGSGYGCPGGGCGYYMENFRVMGGVCDSTPQGCRCVSGPYIGSPC